MHCVEKSIRYPLMRWTLDMNSLRFKILLQTICVCISIDLCVCHVLARRSLTTYIFKFNACTKHSFLCDYGFFSLHIVACPLTISMAFTYLLNFCTCFVLDPLWVRRYSRVVAIIEASLFFYLFLALFFSLSFGGRFFLHNIICSTKIDPFIGSWVGFVRVARIHLEFTFFIKQKTTHREQP